MLGYHWSEIEPSPLLSANGAWQPQPRRPAVGWRSEQEVTMLSQAEDPTRPLLCAHTATKAPLLLMSERGQHALTRAYESGHHCPVSLIKCCVWWWKLGCDERVSGGYECSLNASGHWILPVLLIRVQQGSVKGLTPGSACALNQRTEALVLIVFMFLAILGFRPWIFCCCLS